MLLGSGVVPGRFPIYGARTRPNADRGDCGWTIWSGDPDLEKASKVEEFDVVEVRALFDRHRPAWEHLALPPGWAFVLGPDGYEDVYEDPAALE